MPIWCGIIGSVLFLFTCYEIVESAMSSDSGPLALGIVYFFRYIRLTVKNYVSHNILRLIGVATFLATLLSWYILLWASWTLIFLTVDGAVVHTGNMQQTASVVETIYFTGFVISTLGNGEFRPVGNVFLILTAVCSICGFVLLSISLAFILSANTAIVKMRQLAGSISALGGSAVNILCNGWNGRDFSQLNYSFMTAANDLIHCAQNMLRFPMISNFHSLESVYGSTTRIVALNEAIIFLKCGIEPDNSTDLRLSIQYLENAISQYFSVMNRIALKQSLSVDVPPLPDWEAFKNKGFPVVPRGLFDMKMNNVNIQEQRRLLHSLILDSGRNWDT